MTKCDCLGCREKAVLKLRDYTGHVYVNLCRWCAKIIAKKLGLDMPIGEFYVAG